MLDIYAVFVDDILAVLTGSIYRNAEIVFTIAQKNRAAFEALIDAGLEHHLLDMMNECYEDVADPYYMAMWMGLIYNMLMKWAKSGTDEPLETTIERTLADLRLMAEAINAGTATYFKPAAQRDISPVINRMT